MIRAQNLHFSKLLRPVLLCALPAMMASSFGQLAMSGRTNNNIIPSTGGRPELVTVLDLRKDTDDAHRLLAKSAQGLMNSEPNRTDKVYLILNDQDEQWLKWLVKQQYVLSVGEMRGLEELLRRSPRRKALLVEDMPAHEAALIAGSERLLLAANKKVVKKFDLRLDRSRDYGDDIDQIGSYGDGGRHRINKQIIALVPSAEHVYDLLDYQIANRVMAVDLKGNSSDEPIMQRLRSKFNENIPCLVTGPTNSAITDSLSSIAIFQIPVDGLSNLSFWTTFRPFERGLDETNSGATSQPRSLYMRDKESKSPWDAEENAGMRSKLPWLRELAPPIFENWIRGKGKDAYRERDDFRIGVINESVYGSAFGADRDRVWLDYLRLSRRSQAAGY